ncbi:MAG: hypothetical protein B7Y39_18630 [Bdellovibrio sp. 28-41-41]|nr:MAG: hypothetical protein B7Y39_18630 [Bdellovibrio sp. 28-41-41]
MSFKFIIFHFFLLSLQLSAEVLEYTDITSRDFAASTGNLFLSNSDDSKVIFDLTMFVAKEATRCFEKTLC